MHLPPMEVIAAGAIAILIIVRWLVGLWLELINRRHVQQHATAMPTALRGFMDQATYAKSIAYTLAYNRFHQIQETVAAVVLVGVVFSGGLPWAFAFFQRHWGSSQWVLAAVVFLAYWIVGLVSWPFDWYAQFHLEARFGFNTMTPQLWWLDRAKGILLSLLLGYPLLVLLLGLVSWLGPTWWLWAWLCLLGIQGILVILTPLVILPWFNRFTPLPKGPLLNRLLQLAERAGFRTRDVQVMDGSKRSRHSNAFFTGLGRFRKIVLFDTLVEQLAADELEAVLAHEIGHYRRHHVLKLLAVSALGLLFILAAVAWLTRQAWFFHAFGFATGQVAVVLLLVLFLAEPVFFWLAPLKNAWSRRYEYQADAFAVQMMHQAQSLMRALRKLHEKNLGNLTPHPWYSRFHYSHPTLLEREQALERVTLG